MSSIAGFAKEVDYPEFFWHLCSTDLKLDIIATPRMARVGVHYRYVNKFFDSGFEIDLASINIACVKST